MRDEEDGCRESFSGDRREVERLMRVKDAILAINASLLEMKDSAQLFDLILEKVLSAVEHATVGCVLLLGDDGMLRIASARGYPAEELPDFRVRLEDTFQWKKSGGDLNGTLIINDLQGFMRVLDIPSDILKDSEGQEIKSTMSTPLVVDGAFLGLLNLDSREDNVFDEVDRILVEFIRSQIPIVIKMFKSHERIRELLAEKDLLIREAHHRIKNNMLTMESILRLQASSVADPGASAALDAACSRVRSMMTLYEKLYIAEYRGALSSSVILTELVDDILENVRGPAAIRAEKRIEDFMIEERRLQPLCIIVNEILTNAAKYAFPGRDSGRVEVSAKREGKTVRIEIADDGVGMPESVDFGRSGGFGLMLVETLASQLSGSVRIDRRGGTRFILELPG